MGRFGLRATVDGALLTTLVSLAALQSGCALLPGVGPDREVQAAIDKAADDPFPSANQVGLAAKAEK
jgi:hypothetical protein